MFIRALEKGECAEHGTRCRTAALMECDYCHGEYILHQITKRVKQSYCSQKCLQAGGYAAIARAVEGRKRFVRIKYGQKLTPTK